MAKREARTAIGAAAEQLRTMALDVAEGTLLGNEEALQSRLGCSRATVRQVARLLEREGVLRVRRGINGGYFSSRPDAGTIEATVSAYLETLEMDPEDVTVIASALWVEAVRKAAAANRDEAKAVVAKLRERVMAIGDNAAFADVRKVEQLCQDEIFKLARSAYVRLIFDINVAFSKRKFASPGDDDSSAAHREFVRAWRDARLLELGAIAEGDIELAAMASRYSRKIWHRRVWSRRRQG